MAYSEHNEKYGKGYAGRGEKPKEPTIENDNMWYHWQRLFSWTSFLYSEDCITLDTLEDLNKSLMELKPLLPRERE